MVNTNTWNRIRYTLYAPFYDRIAGSFNNTRSRSIQLLNLQSGERILLLGAGTGIDLEFLPKHVEITAIDITPAMVGRIEERAYSLGYQVEAWVMDGQALSFPDATFDAVVLHLVLAVIPDPYSCISEATRVLKRGGRITIFDKFLPDTVHESILRRIANAISGFLFSDINRRLGQIIATVPLTKVHEEPARFEKLGYGITVLTKQ